eukprot:SAG11_NODE_194_length_12858_cov_28.436946_3_plen_173_part_00
MPAGRDSSIWTMLLLPCLLSVPLPTAEATLLAHAHPLALYPLAPDPFTNPAQIRAWTKPPQGWATNKPHFCAYRGGLAASGLDTYQNASLGDVVWPQWPALVLPSDPSPVSATQHAGLNDFESHPGPPAQTEQVDDLTTLKAQLEDFRKRGLWLVDISNYGAQPARLHCDGR